MQELHVLRLTQNHNLSLRAVMMTREEALEKFAAIQVRRKRLVEKKFMGGLGKKEVIKLKCLDEELDALYPILYPEHHKWLNDMIAACDALKQGKSK